MDYNNTPLNNSVITTDEFLKYIHGINADIYFNVNKITWKNKPQTYAEAAPKLQYLNNQGLDICFIVNAGGSKDSDITCINAVFSDIDVGRDNNNKYFPDDVVLLKKSAVYNNYFSLYPHINNSLFSFSSALSSCINTNSVSCSLTPTFINETRNGFQVFWSLHPGANSAQFRDLQQRIAHFFHSDTSVCNPARVMRLPGYNWIKPDSGCNPFYVGVKYYNDIRYSISQVLDSFPPLPQETPLVSFKQDKRAISTHNNTRILKDKTSSIIMGTFPEIPSEPVILKNMKEVVKYLKQQNLAEYLYHEPVLITENNLHTGQCPFHEDETPSASIHIYKEDYLLTCHSDNCKFKSGSIIEIVAEKEDITMPEAIQNQ